MISFTPFPNIETKNLLLRRMNLNDVDDLFEMRKDPLMSEHTDSRQDESSEDTRTYIDKMNKGVDNNEWIIWAIEHRQTEKVIGSVCIWNISSELESAELGYGIIPGFQGKGLMKEALLSAVEYGFSAMGLKALDAYTEENNHRSVKLLEGCGFIEVDRVDDDGYYNNRVYHMIVYRLNNNKIN